MVFDRLARVEERLAGRVGVALVLTPGVGGEDVLDLGGVVGLRLLGCQGGEDRAVVVIGREDRRDAGGRERLRERVVGARRRGSG